MTYAALNFKGETLQRQRGTRPFLMAQKVWDVTLQRGGGAGVPNLSSTRPLKMAQEVWEVCVSVHTGSARMDACTRQCTCLHAGRQGCMRMHLQSEQHGMHAFVCMSGPCTCLRSLCRFISRAMLRRWHVM
jgi:hypothetical protein